MSGIFSYLSQSKFSGRPTLKYVLFPIVYLITVISVLNTTDTYSWLNLIKKNGTLVCIPLGFYLVKEVTERFKIRVMRLFAFLAFVCLIATGLYSLLNNSKISKLALESKNIEPAFGPSHIEFGLLTAIGFVFMCNLFLKERQEVKKWAWLLMVLISFVLLHLFAYRFALFSIYSISVIFTLYIIVSKKKYSQGLLIFVFLIFTGLLLFHSIDSFKNRIINTRQDLESVFQDKNPNFQSLHQRWVAIKCAVEIVKKNPLIGVAPADLSLEMQQQYTENSYLLIPENRVFIHNQLIFYTASYGILFVFLFVFAFLYILFKESKYSYFYIIIMTLFLLHMLIDNTLERQITTSAMLFFMFLLGKTNKIYQ